MKRQMIGIVGASLLAIVGTIALVAYVQSAKDDAVEDQNPIDVLVLTDRVAQGTTVAELESKVTMTPVPSHLVAPDAVTDLAAIDPTLVAAVDLQQGEQLLSTRLVDPRTLVRVDVPDGLQEITVALTPERAVGADLLPGDTVGVLFSFEPFEVTASGTPAASVPVDPAAPTVSTVGPTRTPNTTHFTLHKVLVTSVQFSQQDSDRAAEIQGDASESDTTETTIAPTVAEAPSDRLLVTLAVSASEAEQLVFAAEFGSIWLTLEGPNATEDDTRILTLSGVYVTVRR